MPGPYTNGLIPEATTQLRTAVGGMGGVYDSPRMVGYPQTVSGVYDSPRMVGYPQTVSG